MLLTSVRGCDRMVLRFDFGPHTRRFDMAEASKKFAVEVDVMEKAWISVALLAKREQLVRSRNKEVTGSDIWQLRGREIDALNQLASKFS